MNKKGAQLPFEEFIFYILNTIFFLALLYFVARSATGASIYEEIYAKKIALMIDEAKPGTYMSIDISKPLEVAKRNSVKTNIFKIEGSKVYVNLGLGYSFNYFSTYTVYSSINWQTGKLDIEVQDE